MRFTFFIILFFQFFTSPLFSQEIEPYYDATNGKWGFHTKDFYKIIIPAQYDDATAWYKDYGIVLIDGKYGMVDRKGNKVSPFILDYMSVEDCESCLMGQLYGIYFYKNNLLGDRKFYVNEKCDCIPQPYWPCPPAVKMDTSVTPKNLKLLQQAEYFYHQGEIKKSMVLADKAIAADTNDASTYFWKASVLTDNNWMIICEDPAEINNEAERQLGSWEREYENQMKELESRLSFVKITQEDYHQEKAELIKMDSLKQIEFNLSFKKADSLDKFYSKWEEESIEFRQALSNEKFGVANLYNKALSKEPKDSWPYKSILAAKYEIKYLSKPEKKAIKKELNKSVERKDRKSQSSIMINPGFSFFPYQNLEVSLTFGSADFMFKGLFPFVAAAGFGYEKGLDLDIESYKAIFIYQPIGPIHGAVNFLFNKNTLTQETAFGIRPEFGFNISAFTILYGYNFVNEEKFPGASGNKVGVRVNLPVWRSNSYNKEWGNNLFRY